MVIDNLESIKYYINPSPDRYWFLQIIARRKDNPNLPRAEKYIKDYYITSEEHLESVKNEIKQLSKFFNARVYFHPSARSFEKLSLTLLGEISKRIINKDYKIHRLQRTISGSTKAIIPELKYWMIDIDTKEEDKVTEVIETIKRIRPDSHIRKLSTLNGFHLITSAFNSTEYYKTISPDIAEIHKNSPILAYFDVSE